MKNIVRFTAILMVLVLGTCGAVISAAADETENQTFSKVIVDNGYFKTTNDLEAALTAEEIAEQFPGSQTVDENDPSIVLVTTEVDEATKEVMDTFMEEIGYAQYITQRPQAYEPESFLKYTEIRETIYAIFQWGLSGSKMLVTPEMSFWVDMLKGARENLVQTGDPEEGIWYIWGDSMPCADNTDEYDWDYMYDTEDFRPFLIPYMVEDQTASVGNIIMVSGGANTWRSNRWEGYACAERFRELGYNCFVLQRRVYPYETIDSALDLERSIRYLRHNAEEYGIANIDRIAVCGFSGGGNTITNMLADCYADASPEAIHASYTPDEIDGENGAVDIAILMYGAKASEENAEKIAANPDLPAIFMVAGQDDFAGFDLGSLDFYKLVEGLVPTEIHIFGTTVHGFGAGACNVEIDHENFAAEVVNTQIWPELADEFMKIRYGLVDQYIRIQ